MKPSLRHAPLLLAGLVACARGQLRDLPHDGSPETLVAFDTELVCGHPDAAAFSLLPLQSATWRDLATRADAQPPDAAAWRGISQLVRANRERYADSVCTGRHLQRLETAAEAHEATQASR